jgi:hypothetical protein
MVILCFLTKLGTWGAEALTHRAPVIVLQVMENALKYVKLTQYIDKNAYGTRIVGML